MIVSLDKMERLAEAIHILENMQKNGEKYCKHKDIPCLQQPDLQYIESGRRKEGCLVRATEEQYVTFQQIKNSFYAVKISKDSELININETNYKEYMEVTNYGYISFKNDYRYYMHVFYYIYDIEELLWELKYEYEYYMSGLKDFKIFLDNLNMN